MGDGVPTWATLGGGLSCGRRIHLTAAWIFGLNGLLYLAIGISLFVVLIGIPILVWWFIWSLVRIVRGFLLVNEHKPIANPKSWLFG